MKKPVTKVLDGVFGVVLVIAAIVLGVAVVGGIIIATGWLSVPVLLVVGAAAWGVRRGWFDV